MWSRFLRPRELLGLAAAVAIIPFADGDLIGKANPAWVQQLVSRAEDSARRSVVSVERSLGSSFRYVVNGESERFVGMGYNPIYRHLSDTQRAERYARDFDMLGAAGVNHILGWDSDKGYEQDKFDEVTLTVAARKGVGVVMPFYLPAEGDYFDEAFRQSLLESAAAKIARFKDFPALRMWGLGNEVLNDMQVEVQRDAFLSFYPQIADLFHTLDPNHPVIYREAEDTWVPQIMAAWRADENARPWLLYGMNFYTARLAQALDVWPAYETGLPLLVTEFGAKPSEETTRAEGYAAMWQAIASHSEYVLGGAPYAWWTRGPEPTDTEWGLMDVNSRPVDGTFWRLAAEWAEGSDEASAAP